MRILVLGEIVGRCGIGVIKNALKTFRKNNNIDFVIANGEGVTNGFGLGFQNAQSLRFMGVNCFVLGEKSFYKMDMVDNISSNDWILRPLNYPEGTPGKGIKTYNLHHTDGNRVCVINVLGMMGFNNPHLNNPFLFIENLVEKALLNTNAVIVIFHAQATAEKRAMKELLQGKASAVFGTHTKVLSADLGIYNGTAYISDLGRCGSFHSVGGFEPDVEIKKYRTQILERSKECWEVPEMQGVLLDLNDKTGKSENAELVKFKVDCIKPDFKENVKETLEKVSE